MINELTIEINKLPGSVRSGLEATFAEFIDKLEQQSLDLSGYPEFIATAPRVWYCSQFVTESCMRCSEMLFDLVSSGDLFSAQHRTQYAALFERNQLENEKELMAALRQFRRREMVRIAWRDLAGWSDLDETLKDMTALAEVCIQRALDFLYRQACNRRGIPTKEDGTPINIVVLGMGKLGAWELNYSSDIDLIFAYAEDGVLTDRKETTYGEFFSRICRNLVKVLDEMTVDGFVFRTDIRLRPFGDSGPVIMTFEGMENYYQTQAREWERYAMIKARQVAGDFSSGQELMAMIKPFVYRRYLDYGAFEELRSLKIQIMHELKRKDRVDNLKLGPGGIREIEFIGQAFQLIRGGQDAELQERGILKILNLLGQKELLTAEDASQLQASYYFLRKAENHIQQYQDKQTHDLPKDEAVQQILAFSMGFSDWECFKEKLNNVKAEVQGVFDHVFSLSEQGGNEKNAEIIWLGGNDEDSLDYLESKGFKQPAETLKVLNDFKNSSSLNRLTVKGMGVINRLIPQLIDAMDEVKNKDETIKRVLHLFEEVAGRNVYLSLLAENPQALLQLIKLTSASFWICRYLTQYPVLFDELLDTRSLYEPLDKAKLNQQLQTCLNKIDVEDVEQLMIKLREFKHLNVLRVAAADIMNVIPLMVVSDYLSYIAEVIVEKVVKSAWEQLTAKHGLPPGTSDLNSGFAVLGFGKLGGMELGYGSDLDLVFLCDIPDSQAYTNGTKPINSTQFYARLGQKVRHIMDTKMLSGVLYEVDMRLRPSGDSGLLVSPVNSYEDYLKNNAWTWEHQALVRGRFVAGDEALKQKYEAIRQRIISLPRDRDELGTDILEMRDKMREALTTKDSAVFDLKQSKGGIVDIEFIVQFHVLAHAKECEALTLYTDNIRLIEALNGHGFFTDDQAETLKSAYCDYRDYGHQQALQGARAIATEDDFVEIRSQVKQIWHQTFGKV